MTFSDKLFSGAIDYFSLSVDGYFNRVRDKIVAIPTLFIWKMLNMGRVNIAGGDVNVSMQFNLSKYFKVDLQGNYSYQYAVDLSNKESKSYKHQLPYTPKNSGNLSLLLINKWVNIGYSASIVGERYALQQNLKENLISRYCDQNISLSRDFMWGRYNLRLKAEVLNIGNVNYDVIKFYPMPGRQFRGTINFNF